MSCCLGVCVCVCVCVTDLSPFEKIVLFFLKKINTDVDSFHIIVLFLIHLCFTNTLN